jgi:hypothetical protein
MTPEFIYDKADGVWNVIDGDEFLEICEYCTRLQCNFRSELLTGCDAFIKPKQWMMRP